MANGISEMIVLGAKVGGGAILLLAGLHFAGVPPLDMPLHIASAPATVSVRDFGAKGDGKADDTVAIQRALDSGSNVTVPAGRYMVTALVLKRSGMKLEGQGTLVKRSGVNALILTIEGDHNQLSGISLDGSAPAPTPGSANDALRIHGSDNSIDRITILGAQGSGIRIDGAARNRITNSTVRDVHQNSILIGNPGANDNYIGNNKLIGTATQNNVFVTADDGSRPSQARIRGNVIEGNFCDGAYDTGIESGQNADNTRILGNTMRASRNPAILLRDGRGVQVIDNVVQTPAVVGQNDGYSGIAVTPLYAGSAWSYDALIQGNRISGAVNSAAIYVGGSGVRVINNVVTGPGGARLLGYGISLAGSVSDVVLQRNQVRGFERGIDLNIDGKPQRRAKVTVERNVITETMTGINAFNVEFDASAITDNDISQSKRQPVQFERARAMQQLRYGKNKIR